MATKRNPGKFDCYENAAMDEPMFVLLGRDPAAGMAVLFWIAMRLALKKNKLEDEQIQEASACAAAMEAWARFLGKDTSKVWDAFKVALREWLASLKQVEEEEAQNNV